MLKNFISGRRNHLLSNAEMAQVSPVISGVAYYVNGTQWLKPGENDSANVRALVSSSNGIFALNLYYSNDLSGNFSKIPMYDDGFYEDSATGDGVYGAAIPAQAAGTWVRFYIKAFANNTAKSVKYEPEGAEHNVYVYIVSPLPSSDTSVVINEIMASNSGTMSDEAGEFDDWIELYNKSSQQVNISGYSLTDNPANLNKWLFPAGTVIPANGYVIVWADEDSSQGANHANFKLSSSGEQFFLLDASGKLVDSASWISQVSDMGYARVHNGTSSFIIQ